MKWYCVSLGIYTKNGHIMGVEDKEFEALDDESAIEEAKALANELEEIYACVMVDELIDQDGNEIQVHY